MATERMDLKKAGTMLGLTPNAVRARAEKGHIPHEKDNRGKWWVFLDPETVANDRVKLDPPNTSNGSSNLTSKEAVFEGQINALEGRVKDLHGQIAGLEGERDDLRRRLDLSEEERRKLVAALIEKTAVPAPPVIAEQPKRWWWPFGRAGS